MKTKFCLCKKRYLVFGIETTIDLPQYYHHGFWFILWTLGVDILWLSMAWFVVHQFNEFPAFVFLRWLGRNITVFCIVQWLIIGNIATAIYQTQDLYRFGYWFGTVFLATIGITFSLKIWVLHPATKCYLFAHGVSKEPNGI